MPELLCNDSFACPSFFSFLYILLGKMFPCVLEPSYSIILPYHNFSEVAHRISVPSLGTGRQEWSWGEQLLDNIESCSTEVVMSGERGKDGTIRLKNTLDCFMDVIHCQFGSLNKTNHKNKTTVEKISSLPLHSPFYFCIPLISLKFSLPLLRPWSAIFIHDTHCSKVHVSEKFTMK